MLMYNVFVGLNGFTGDEQGVHAMKVTYINIDQLLYTEPVKTQNYDHDEDVMEGRFSEDEYNLFYL